MAEEPTNGELARLIERNHTEVKEDFQALYTRMDREYAAMNGRVEQMVPRGEYEADQRANDERFRRIEVDIASGRATVKWAVGLAVTALLAILGMALPLLAR